jgi:hypothetical protein
MKTTLEMPDELFRRAKTMAAQRGQSLKQLVTVALERELAGPVSGFKTSKRKRAEVEVFLRELDKISKEISAAWPKGVSAVEAIREQRRY